MADPVPDGTPWQRRRAREQFCRVFFDDGVEAGLADYLTKYFLQFAVAARSQ